MTYFIFKWLCRISVQFFFSEIEINGEENLPAKGVPMIYAANHQSAFLDAVILGVLSKTPVHYLTRADVFNGPLKHFLHAINMMPIYRYRDGKENLYKNEEVFAKCHNILKEKKRLLIFPEGNQAIEYFLRPLKVGIAKISMNPKKEIVEEIQIIPSGINYYNHLHSGHKLILNYGQPIFIKDYVEAFKVDPKQAYSQLLLDLAASLKEVMVIPENSENYKKEKLIFNKPNEIFKYAALKKQLNTDDFNTKAHPQKYLWPLKIILSIPNFPAIALLWYILNKLMTNLLFMASLKVAFGAIIFPLWLLISFLIIGLIFNWGLAGIVLVVQVLCMMLLPRVNARIRGR